MIIIIIFLVLGSCLLILAFLTKDFLENYDLEWVTYIIGTTAILILFVSLSVLPFWISSEKNVKLINNKYNTNYTTSDYFWCKETVEKIIRTETNLKDQNIKIELESEE